MKTIAFLVLSLCLPVFADDFAVTLGKDGALSVDGKEVGEKACSEALKAAADKSKQGQISALKLAIRCAPETLWGPVQHCINQAAEAGVWDIQLTVGDKTIAIPLPKDCDDLPEIFFPDAEEEDKKDPKAGDKKDGENGDKKEMKKIFVEIRVFVWTGETGDLAKDSAAGPSKTATKTWARLNQGSSADISSSPSTVLESVRALLKEQERDGKKNPATIFDVSASVAMKHVFALASALKDSATGSPRIEFAAPLPVHK